MLNFTGFTQDTIAVFEEPPSVVRREYRTDIGGIQTLPKTKTKLPKEKNPKVATWLSVALPGAGQVYNGHWYKVPVIYGGFGALIYFHNLNTTERNIFQKEYRGRLLGDSAVLNADLIPYSTDQILNIRNYYQRNIELVYIFSGLLYILNIVDACVFAHLSTFDVSDNLSLRIQPYASPDLTPYTANQRLPMKGGLRLTFTLK
jgi:hypothetical protein